VLNDAHRHLPSAKRIQLFLLCVQLCCSMICGKTLSSLHAPLCFTQLFGMTPMITYLFNFIGRLINLQRILRVFSLFTALHGMQTWSSDNNCVRPSVRLSVCLDCYKVSFCENCQRQRCKAFIGLTNCAKMIVGRRPLLP